MYLDARRSKVSDEQTRHSGSRWEPAPALRLDGDPAGAPTDAATDRPADPAAGRIDDETIPQIPLLGASDPALHRPTILSDAKATRPRRRRRAGLLAAAAAGLLAVGGAGGYVIGHAAANIAPTGVGTASGPGGGTTGGTGGLGHHRGGSGPDGGQRGGNGDGSTQGGPQGDGSTQGGTGSTGTST
jgi:hypothetical protein